jgi:hypothetical protein
MTADSEAQDDPIYRARILRSRQMTGEERMLEGVRLFEAEQESVRVGFAKTMPDASDAELTEAVRRHFHLAREQERGPDFYEKLRYLPVP